MRFRASAQMLLHNIQPGMYDVYMNSTHTLLMHTWLCIGYICTCTCILRVAKVNNGLFSVSVRATIPR